MKEKLRVRTAIVLRTTTGVSLEAARLALFNALLARRYDQPLVLRIDNPMDDDGAGTEAMLDDLRWLGVEWTAGPDVGGEHAPYLRSHRSSIYAAFYVKLIEMGRAYPCFCTERELEAMRRAQIASGITPHYAGGCNRLNRQGRQHRIDKGLPAVLRFAIRRDWRCHYDDLLLGQYHCGPDEVGDFVIRGRNGDAQRVFTTTVDDALFGVTHRFRGIDERQQVPQQLALADALGLPLPLYGHLPRLLPAASEQDGLPTLTSLRRAGYRPEAVLNHLARLGHRYDSELVLDFDELARQFRLSRLCEEPVFHRRERLDAWQAAVTA